MQYRINVTEEQAKIIINALEDAAILHVEDPNDQITIKINWTKLDVERQLTNQ